MSMRPPLAILALLALTAASRADTVRLKTGHVLEGRITEENPREVRIRTANGSELTVARAEIAEVERGEAPLDTYKKRAAELKDDDADGHFALAEFCLQNRLFTEAIAHLRRTLELRKDHKEAREKLTPLLDQRALPLLNQAKRLQDQGQFEEAEAPLIAILEQYPDSSCAALAHHRLAVGLAARKRYDMAITRWRRALALDPRLADAYEGAAHAAAEAARWADAAAFTESAIPLAKSTDHARGLKERAEALRELARFQEAGEGSARDPKRLAAEARVLIQLGQRDRALLRYQDAYNAGTREPEILKLLADYNEREGRVRQALEIYKELLAANPSDAELLKRRANAERLLAVGAAFATPDKARRDRILFDIARTGASFDAIEGALRECTERAPEKTGLVEGSFFTDATLQRVTYLAYVPKLYDPRRPWPLIIALHRDGESGKEHYYNWETIAANDDAILLFPTSPGKAGGWKFMHLGVPTSALHHATRLYNIDTNRVYLAGVGSGGMLAWAAAVRHPHRFAALVVTNAVLDEVSRLHLRAAATVPTYLIVSEQAPPDVVGSTREAHKALEGWGYDVQKEEVPGYTRNPALPELNTKVRAWLQSKVRNPYPPRVRLMTYEPAAASAFWLRIERFAPSAYDPDRRVAIRSPFGQEYSPEQLHTMFLGEIAKGMGQVAAAIAPGNRIDLVTRNIEELTVFLDDKMVDLDKPVRIIANGEAVFSGKLERSLEQLFDSARYHRDPRLCYSAAIRVKVRDR